LCPIASRLVPHGFGLELAAFVVAFVVTFAAVILARNVQRKLAAKMSTLAAVVVADCVLIFALFWRRFAAKIGRENQPKNIFIFFNLPPCAVMRYML